MEQKRQAGTAPNDEKARLLVAANLAREGDLDAAREAFEAICTANNDCEAGWLWLASLVDDAETGLDCLREVLRINPGNKTALQWLEKSETPAPPPRRLPKCPLCHTSWKEPMRQCHSCHALYDLSKPSAFAVNDRINRRVMEIAIEQLAEKRGAPFEREYYLAVAHFNLLQSKEGLWHLDRAAKINPQEKRLASGEIIRRWNKRPRVVVADDSLTVREVIARTMEKSGLMALLAATGPEALVAVKENKPALVLMDVNMPGMDGYQVCKAIRANAATKAIPVVLVSNRDGMFNRAKGKMAGANDYVAKPFQPEQLAELAKTYSTKEPQTGRR